MADYPFVSIVIPCRNEEGYIGTVLKNILEQDYPSDRLEVIVADGESTDGTVQEIEQIKKDDGRISLLNNPGRIVPTGLNLAIKESKGEIILRMDAHCEYPINYVSYLVENLISLQADNVGVVMKAYPRNNSTKAYAISAAISSPFGVGDSYHRTGIDQPVEMDSVPFGCYWRSVFDRVGFFDEELVRNQDDEFNSRLGKSGGKIILLPDIQIKYLARDTVKKIARMFYYYGLFKPLVNKKVGQAATIRQFVPPLFVLSILAVILLSLINMELASWLMLITIIPYLVINILYSVYLGLSSERKSISFLLPILFPIIHVSYGYGYLLGILKFMILNQRAAKDLSTNR